MSEPICYDFDERLAMSQNGALERRIKRILLDHIPSALSVVPAHQENDRHGTDWWVECRNGKHLSVDCKIRSKDHGKHDVALETWSVVEKSVVGWTRDKEKQTDYVLWVWADSGRWELFPFQMLLVVFEENWQQWTAQYGTERQYTPRPGGGYHSECVFVPSRDVWAAIYYKFRGQNGAKQ